MRLVFAGLAVSSAALLVACGGGSERSATPTTSATSASAATATRPTTSAIVPAATATAVPATLAPAPPSPPAPSSTDTPLPPPPPPAPTEPPPAPGVTLTVVAVNVLFATKSLSAPAGSITIVFDNQDASVAHNIHFFSRADSIGMTEITTGPAMETLSLGTLAPGAYSYKCDVHPTTMTGVLTVS